MAALLFFLFGDELGLSGAREEDRQAIALGGSIYAENCASCHGANGEGQEGWKTDRSLAPPHDTTGHTWQHADRELTRYIKTGFFNNICTVQPGSGMPTFKGTLNDNEINAVIAYIVSRWPPHVRSLHEAVNREYEKQNKGLYGIKPESNDLHPDWPQGE
jgi:mono/diheme cytochrome c family protein